jgi:hypothetical protein
MAGYRYDSIKGYLPSPLAGPGTRPAALLTVLRS